MWKCKHCGGIVGAKTYQIEELDKKGEYSEELENIADWVEENK